MNTENSMHDDYDNVDFDSDYDFLTIENESEEIFNKTPDHATKSARRRLDDYFEKKMLQERLADY